MRVSAPAAAVMKSDFIGDKKFDAATGVPQREPLKDRENFVTPVVETLQVGREPDPRGIIELCIFRVGSLLRHESGLRDSAG